ncbi:MAG: phosphate signaling complex protein PhoU [Actinobacteria bacterium]|nr:phosphate signaling complex protein PhoU [Actinomycetota bacterium]
MRKTFHEQLNEITEDVISMGSLAQQSVHDSIEALVEMNSELAEKIIDGDRKIDDYDISIEEKCVILQAEYQPVAKDLRLLHSISIIIIHIERIGDLAVNIAKVVKRFAKGKIIKIEMDIIELLVEMGNLVKLELTKALTSFKNKDAKLAAKLDKIDNAVDDIQKEVFKKLYSKAKYAEDNKFIANVSLASRYLERIGDQSVNIGERVIFFLTGDYKIFHKDT